MKKEDGKLKLRYCNNSRCELYQRELSDAAWGKALFCPYCGAKLSSNERPG